MRLLFLLLVALGAISGLPVEDRDVTKFNAILQSAPGGRNSALEELILSLLETVRELMRTGIGSIPVLDPLQVDDILVDGELLPILEGSHMEIRGLSVKQLSNFVVDLSVVQPIIILPRYRIQIDGHIPVIEVESENYDMNLSLFGFTLFGNGKLDIKINRPTLGVNLEIGVRLTTTGAYIEIRSADITFSLGRCDFAITGLFNDEGATDFVNIFLRILISDLLEEYEADINEFLSTTVYEVGNEILEDLNLISIIRPYLK